MGVVLLGFFFPGMGTGEPELTVLTVAKNGVFKAKKS